MKLSIQGLDARTSDKLIQAVLKVCDINEDGYNAIIGDTIENTVDCASNEGETEHNLNRIALLFPGNNLPKTIEDMRNYVIIGDGPCPHCGGDNFIERGLTDTCLICGYDWTPEFETSKYYQL
jgi:hypothetical protein